MFKFGATSFSSPSLISLWNDSITVRALCFTTVRFRSVKDTSTRKSVDALPLFRLWKRDERNGQWSGHQRIFKYFLLVVQYRNWLLPLKTLEKNAFVTTMWCPIKVRVFHQNESCLSCPHPPLSYEGRREQKRQLSFCWKTLILIGHYGIA